MPSRSEAKRVARRLRALSGGAGVVRKAAARELSARHPVDANELLAELLGLARAGDFDACAVLGAFVHALDSEAAQIPPADELRRVADVQELRAVAALFVEDPPRLEMDPLAAARADARAFSESLGHQKTLARSTRDPDDLARFALNSNPLVVRNLLLNPRLTEPLVVRIASRRPARPEPLVEIWRSAKWSARHAVRRALVFNPYFPPEAAAKVVALLTRTDLEELAADARLHPVLRAQAALLLDGAGEGSGAG